MELGTIFEKLLHEVLVICDMCGICWILIEGANMIVTSEFAN